MNIVQVQSMIREMPDAALGHLMSAPSPDVPDYLVLAEFSNRQRLRQAQGATPGQTGPNMKEEALMMTRGDMGNQVRSFAEGGPVYPYSNGLPQATQQPQGPFIPSGAQGTYNSAMSSFYSGAPQAPMAAPQPGTPPAGQPYPMAQQPQMPAYAIGGPIGREDKPQVNGNTGPFGAFGHMFDNSPAAATKGKGSKGGAENTVAQDKPMPLGGGAANFKFAGGGAVHPRKMRYDMSGKRCMAAGGQVGGLMKLVRGPDGKVGFGE
jgi:hypothetical protein